MLGQISECRIFLIIMLSVIMLSVIVLNVAMLSVLVLFEHKGSIL